jgi:hypothetical protein
MKKTGMFLFAGILFGASLLAACGQSPAPSAVSANPGAPAAATVAPAATAAPLVIASPQATVASSIPVAGDNCAILSKDEVGKILGEAVVDLKDPTKNGLLCEYLTQNLIVELEFLHVFMGAGNSVNYMQQLRTDGLGVAPVEVSGLGDESLYHGDANHRVLYVRKGETVYAFGVRKVTADQSMASPDNAQDLEKSLADLLLPRVP